MLTRIDEAREEWRPAYSAYTKTVELAPENLEARVKLGALSLAGGRVEAALAQTEAVLASDPERSDALALRGAARLRQGEPEAALADAEAAYRQIIERAGEGPEAMRARAKPVRNRRDAPERTRPP